ncbi:glycosyltransferase [Methylomarinum sp. Ch1-1]|uniref:Glycosyltransferase n=1 Tax=Methylomarinum roseum TaxID=3067653 RepID=A0AAU7NUN6_9GAMM
MSNSNHESSYERWQKALHTEISFWRSWLETKGLQWPEDYAARTDPDSELNPNIGKWHGGSEAPSILDVGAGPMTILGKKWQGKPVDLQACDALGDEYDLLPFSGGLPLVRTRRCHSEELTAQYPRDSFDIVHAQNTLDHSYAPDKAILEMLSVAKVGRVVYLCHIANEAEKENYHGLHQWNFEIKEDVLWLYNKQEKISVNELIKEIAEVAYLSPDGSDPCIAVFRKTKSFENRRDDKIILSILVPSYRGYLESIAMFSKLAGIRHSSIEILVADNSGDEHKWRELKNISRKADNFHVLQNERGLIARDNYWSILKSAKGKFIFVCADDDYIDIGFFLDAVERLKTAANNICITPPIYQYQGNGRVEKAPRVAQSEGDNWTRKIVCHIDAKVIPTMTYSIIPKELVMLFFSEYMNKHPLLATFMDWHFEYFVRAWCRCINSESGLYLYDYQKWTNIGSAIEADAKQYVSSGLPEWFVVFHRLFWTVDSCSFIGSSYFPEDASGRKMVVEALIARNMSVFVDELNGAKHRRFQDAPISAATRADIDRLVAKNSWSYRELLDVLLSLLGEIDAEKAQAYWRFIDEIKSADIQLGFQWLEGGSRSESQDVSTNDKVERTPLVSVVIPCYKQAHYLPEVVASVVAQTFADWECIIVNDGSPDDTGEVARQLIRQYSGSLIRLLEQGNGGLSDARNKGIGMASGKYILPLDADDKLDSTMLEKTVAVLQSDPTVGIVYTYIRHFGSRSDIWKTGPFSLEKEKYDNYLPYCSLYRKEVFESVGGYDTNFNSYEDWNFWISAMERGWHGKLVPEPLFLYRKGDSSMLVDANKRREQLVAQIVLAHPEVYPQDRRLWASRLLDGKADDAASSLTSDEQTSPSLAAGGGRKKILIVCSHFWPSVGGLESSMEQLSLELFDQGYVVTVLTQQHAGRTGRDFHGVTIVSEDQVQFPQAIASAVASEVYDCCILVQDPLGPIIWSVEKLLPLQSGSVIIQPIINEDGYSKWIGNQSFRERLSRILKSSSAVLTMTQSGADVRFMRQSEIESCYIPNAVAACEPAGDFRARYSISGDAFLILHVANLYRVKNHLGLIDALDNLPENWKLVMIGHPTEADCAAAVSEKLALRPDVLFIPGLDKEWIAAAMEAADAVVLASHGEGSPITVLEAMSHKTPWLATPMCGAVHDHAGGIVCELADFKQVLGRLSDSPELGRRLGEIGYQHWSGCYSWQAIIQGWVDLIETGRLQRRFDTPRSLLSATDETLAEFDLVSRRHAFENPAVPFSCETPLVSVILPTLNRLKLLPNAIRSLQQQRYQNWEAIIINDGGAPVVLSDGLADPRIKLMELNRNHGQSQARNIGLKFAKGEVICFLDDDDVFKPDHLATVVKGLESTNFVYTLAESVLYDDDHSVVRRAVIYNDIKYSRERLYVSNFIPINTWGVRSDYLKEVGFFEESLLCLEDWELLIRLSSRCRFHHIPKVTVEVHERQGATSVTKAHVENYSDVFEEIYHKHGCLNSTAVKYAQNHMLASLTSGQKDGRRKIRSIAVILHLSDAELWDELCVSLSAIARKFDLYVTTLEGKNDSLIDEISNRFPESHVYQVRNKGRDILPFLTVYREIQALGYDLILKLHCSPAMQMNIDGSAEQWRGLAMRSLVQWQKRVDDIIELFEADSKLGIFAPFGYLNRTLSGDVNFPIIQRLIPGIDKKAFDKSGFVFPAGSMFWFRPAALESLLALNLNAEAFENEAGDGTLVHAVERLFGVLCRSSGYTITDRLPKLDDIEYQNWLEKKRDYELSRDGMSLAEFPEFKPAIRCFVFVEQTDLTALADTLDSLGGQTYSNWHLTVVSSLACPDPLFDEMPQLGWVTREPPLDVAALLLLPGGRQAEWGCFLELGDYLEPHALSCFVEYSHRYPGWEIIYSDEDRVSPEGFFHSPRFKPEFNLDLFYATDYIGGLVMFRKTLLERCDASKFPDVFLSWELVLRGGDKDYGATIGHIPNILLHRREAADQARLLAGERRKSGLSAYFREQGRVIEIADGLLPGTLYLQRPLTSSPLVSIIIPTKNRLDLIRPCVESILEKTGYPHYEILIVDNQSDDPETLVYLSDISVREARVHLLSYDLPYNFSAINNVAAERAQGDYLLLLNNDTVIIQEEWLSRLLAEGLRSDVGIVGPRLIFPNKQVQHAGVVLGLGQFGVADHPFIGEAMDAAGYMGRLQLTQDYSAVTAACLLLEKDLYKQVSGLDAENFGVLFNDVDLCLKVKELGYRIVWTPFSTVVHHGSSSLKKEKPSKKQKEGSRVEADHILKKWLPQLARDPAFNRNLSLKHFDFQLETKTDVSWNVDFHDKPRIYAFPGNETGVGEYRVRSPLRALTNAAMIQSSLLPNHDEAIIPDVVEVERAQPDVLFLQNAFADYFIEAWGRYRRFNDVFMVYGQDDLLYTLPKKHPKQGKWPKDIRRRLKKMMRLSDRVIVANEVLAKEFGKFTDNIVIVPNYLETERWLTLDLPEKLQQSKPRVGWAGGVEHQGDLELILPVVEALHQEVDWVFMGMCPEALRPYIKEFYPGVAFHLYPQKLAELNLDLAIAPLEHNKFNEAKTNLRLLEYGVLGWPVVCTDILPYQDAPVTRVANNSEHWIRIIRDKIQEPDLLRQEGQQLRRWVVDNYILEDHLQQWYGALLP